MDRRVKDWILVHVHMDASARTLDKHYGADDGGGARLWHALEMVVDSAGLRGTSSTSRVEPSVLADCVPRWLTSQGASHRRRRLAKAEGLRVGC
jgi:hypothetical protein